MRPKLALSSIDVVYENCESCTIPVDKIYGFYMRGISNTVYLYEGEIVRGRETKFLRLDVLPGVYPTKLGDNSGSNFKDRTHKYRDIVSLSLNYEDGSYDKVSVNFKDRLDTNDNALQNFESCESLYHLTIGKKKDE